MEVVAAVAVGTISFEGEVDAGFGFIFLGDVYFLSYFVFVVCEGALDSCWVTCSLKGQYPFSRKYLHF